MLENVKTIEDYHILSRVIFYKCAMTNISWILGDWYNDEYNLRNNINRNALPTTI